MGIQRTRKNKENPHYNFLYSWSPTAKTQNSNKGISKAAVNRESDSYESSGGPRLSASKKAAELAKAEGDKRIKKDLIKTLIVVSFILIVEFVVYLAWKRLGLS
jgi:hypothetical protein